MILDNMLPVVGAMLNDRYRSQRRAYAAEAARLKLVSTPWPERRTSKRKPIPGVLDVVEIEG